MDAFSDPSVSMVVVQSSSQVGKTEILNNVVGYFIDQDPSPILVVMPNKELAEEWSTARFDPMVRDTPALAGKVAKQASRNRSNTMRRKLFPGGRLAVAIATAAGSLASRPIRVLLADEVDRYSSSVDNEGDPVNIADRRTQRFWNRKRGLFSSPKIKGLSRIEHAYLEGDQHRWWVPCGLCGVFQVMTWGQVRWPPGEPLKAAYVCAHCEETWQEAQRIRFINAGEWRPSAPFNGIASFKINEISSPWGLLGDMAKDFLASKDKPDMLQVWTNTREGETFEAIGEEIDGFALSKRRLIEPTYLETDPAPAGVLLMTCGMDTQADRIEVERVGWGMGEESWSLDYQIIPGDLSAPEIWAELDDYLRTPTKTADGRELYVQAACIDSGGAYTDQVYRFAADKARRRIYAIKGFPGPRPIWPRRASKSKKSGQTGFYIVGVDSGKDIIAARFKIEKPGPGYCHFPVDRELEWFEQQGSETVVTKFVKGFPVRVWELRPNRRNEAFDCRNYAFAALRSMQVHWGAIKREVERLAKPAPVPVEAEPDPFVAPPESAPAPPPPRVPKVVRSSYMMKREF